MKVGDLIKDVQYSEVGLIIDKRDKSDVCTYRVINQWGTVSWFPREYIENDCKVVCESRV